MNPAVGGTARPVDVSRRRERGVFQVHLGSQGLRAPQDFQGLVGLQERRASEETKAQQDLRDQRETWEVLVFLGFLALKVSRVIRVLLEDLAFLVWMDAMGPEEIGEFLAFLANKGQMVHRELLDQRGFQEIHRITSSSTLEYLATLGSVVFLVCRDSLVCRALPELQVQPVWTEHTVCQVFPGQEGLRGKKVDHWLVRKETRASRASRDRQDPSSIWTLQRTCSSKESRDREGSKECAGAQG